MRVTRRAMLGTALVAVRGAAAPLFGQQPPTSFRGVRPGDQRVVATLALCWCPAGSFLMGSPRSEPERRPAEDQVEVTLTKGFWMAKYESTQGDWKRLA